MNRQFVVVGLGRLGTSMVGTLDSLGHEVLAIARKALDRSPLVEPDGP